MAGTAQLAPDHQQPGAEHGGGVGALGVLEERRVDRAGAVVEGQEHHAAPGPDRRGLGGDLDPGDQDLGPAALGQQVAAADRTEGVEEVGVGVDDVAARVEAEDLQLGTHPLLGTHLGQAADVLLRLVTEVEGELDRGHRTRIGRGPGLGGGSRPDPWRGQGVALHRRRRVADGRVGAGALGGLVGAGVGRPHRRARTAAGGQTPGPAGPLDRPGVPVELGHLEQQVAAGDLGTAAYAHQPTQRGAEPVEGVEPAGQHQPLGDRTGHLRAVPEVGQRVVGPGCDDPLDLAGVDALHLGQGEPDAPGPAVGPAAVGRVGSRRSAPSTIGGGSSSEDIRSTT